TAFVQEGTGGTKAEPEPGAGDEAAPEPAAATGSTVGREAPTGTAHGSPPASATSSFESGGARHRLFTWRNAILGGVAAFALLGLVTAGWMAMRTLGIGPAGTLVAKGLIEEGEGVILADFENLTPDSLLGDVVTEAFRVDLAQTPVVSLVEPAYVADVLERMERPTEGRLDEELAREVAIREGIKAVIVGEIGTAGGAYVLSARVLSADAGQELESLRETANDSSEIVSTIDDLSERLRERLGESLRSVRGGEPLARVTTGSLEALRKYSQAVTAIYRGERDKGVGLLEEAVEIDSTFAMAWRKLATVVFGERQLEAATRAYELRDRLTERERYHTIGIYHFYVTRDLQRSATAYRTLLDDHPDDGLALNNLSVNYLWMGDLERALETALRARDVGFAGMDPYMRSVRYPYRLGRPDEARAALARLSEDRPDHPVAVREQWALALLDGDLETARAAASRLLDHEVTFWANQGRFYLVTLELSRGRLAAAREQIDSVRPGSDLDRARRWAEVDLEL
ncbi:MAG: tetratricopeptide repeat protein, partial [Gemmatimonadota bacterium]|nr:tetratricopeptide repeat protein [Gemmatimonadota bacterium]